MSRGIPSRQAETIIALRVGCPEVERSERGHHAGRKWPPCRQRRAVCSGPGVVRDRVKIRLVNLSATDHHPIHMHGHQFSITETDGGICPPSAQQMESTI